MSGGYGFTEDGVRRIVAAVRAFERGTPRPRASAHSRDNWQFVRVVGEPLDCGSGAGSGGVSGSGAGSVRYWPAVVEEWNIETEAADDLGECLLVERHDYALKIGNAYMSQQTGDMTLCGTTYDVFITAIGVAGLEDDTGSGSGDGSGGASGSGAGACTTTTSNQIVLNLPAGCDIDGNQLYNCLTLTFAESVQVKVEQCEGAC